MKLDKESLSALLKLAVFFGFTGGATLLLMVVLSQGLFQSTETYQARFSDATGVAKGDDVRISGVRVGEVKSVDIVESDEALVTFGVDSDIPLTQNTNAQLRFRNLVGQRYMALYQGGEGGTQRLEPGSTIPQERTEEALDLNVLLNGFKPVFQALSPEDTNQLAFELVQTLQGEAGNVESLLARTASLTQTLAGRDELIGDVITNLSDVLDTIGSRDEQLTSTIDNLQALVTGLKEDRGAILGSLDSISLLTEETSGLLSEGRDDLAADVKQLNRLSGNLSKKKNLDQVEKSLQILPIKLEKLGNLASNGSLFNFYVCELDVDLEMLPGDGAVEETVEGAIGSLLNLPEGQELSNLKTGGARCATEGGEY
ncbi:MCE family protein [Aeromicrobium sp. CTD01-1L150]|uniref:MCE family protein n=1 Tax=Aeromicrobium sp. CTD01-1L150 TaxID=3341830 RepID=UPI0035C0FDA2